MDGLVLVGEFDLFNPCPRANNGKYSQPQFFAFHIWIVASRACSLTMESIYKNQTYLALNPGWHEEDSHWKAAQLFQMLGKHHLSVNSVAEIGCGAGGVIAQLHKMLPVGIDFHGFDIAPDAVAMAKEKECERLHFHQEDLLENKDVFDLLLVIDVIEHVPDYLGFLEGCRDKARFKLYHIPLDIHVSSVTRGSIMEARTGAGHLHYFSAESAVASLIDTGHKILDSAYTAGALDLPPMHRSLKRTLANIPRSALSPFSRRWAARLFGGFSLLVLTE